MSNILRIARKEFAGFFSSPIAFIFLGAFLAVSLFVFFWVETFFARNIADVRPLFEWLPLLLIFLVVYAATVIPFFINARFRMPLAAVLIIFSAAAVVAWFRWLRSRPGIQTSHTLPNR